MRKQHKTILFTFVLASLTVLFVAPSCNKNKDDDTMKNIISYTGKTDQDSTILFQTGTINDQLYLKSYTITVGYNDGGSEASHTASEDNSDGIMLINNNYFEVEIDSPGNYIKANIVSNANSITGTYSYRFEGIGETVSGTFSSVR